MAVALVYACRYQSGLAVVWPFRFDVNHDVMGVNAFVYRSRTDLVRA